MSVYSFFRALETGLKERGYPYRVHYTPFLDTKQAYGSSVVIAHARGSNEQIGSAIGPTGNPRKVITRYPSAEIYVFAQSSKPGAHVGEHEIECDGVADMVLSEAHLFVRSSGSPTFAVPEARYLTAEERAALGGFVERWPGVVYYTRILVPHGVSRLDYKGLGAPEGEVGEVDTTLNADGTADSFDVIA